jgi:hypothetical protein
MGNPANGSKWLAWTMPALFAGGLAWAIAQSDDRYRASEAERDQRMIADAIEKAETRMIKLLDQHASGGPHDDVLERIVRIEERLKSLEREKRDVSDY